MSEAGRGGGGGGGGITVAEQGVLPPGVKYIYICAPIGIVINIFASEIAAPVKVPPPPPLPPAFALPLGGQGGTGPPTLYI